MLWSVFKLVGVVGLEAERRLSARDFKLAMRASSSSAILEEAEAADFFEGVWVFCKTKERK